MKKHIVLISVGVLNVLHGSFHIVQFIQSMFFVAYATNKHDHTESFIESVMHNPIFALLMGIIGILTLTIGIKDYQHHRRCATNHKHTELTLEQEYADALDKVETLGLKIRSNKKDDKHELIFWE